MGGNLYILVLICMFPLVTGLLGSTEQAHGYIDVRKGCHMFYWLFYAAEMGKEYTKRPLIIWLQGGPGGSSTGDGNFKLIGPLDMNFEHRESAWTIKFNVLFIDNPVGTGFSYVDNTSLFVRSNREVVQDLIKFMFMFYTKHPEFSTVPLYIFGQSYGGKMAVEFAFTLNRSMKTIMNVSAVKGVALGNAWISPADNVLGWASVLETIGAVSKFEALEIRKIADHIKHLIEFRNYYAALTQASTLQNLILDETTSFNFYDISLKTKNTTKAKESSTLSRAALELADVFGLTRKKAFNFEMDYIMNNVVKSNLDIPYYVVWGAQTAGVGQALAYDIMKPAINEIKQLLNADDIKIIIYNGNHDLICGTLGQQAWLNRLKWKKSMDYKLSARKPIWIRDQLEGYVKGYDNFKFYWVNGAGHSVPADNPAVMDIILEDLTSF